MSKTKTLRKIVFLSLMCLSAILLCFVGVYAVNPDYKIRPYTNVNPEIKCKVEYAEGNGSFSTILDNYNQDNKGKYPALNTNITLSGGNVASELTFKLTNYTSGKHIRLKITNVKINGSSYPYNILTPICCDANSSSSQDWTISSKLQPAVAPQTEPTTLSLTFNIVLEEVHKITVSGEGLANNNQRYYFSSTQTPEVTLTPALGYQLPQSVTSSNSSCISYSVTNNSQATATFDTLTTDQTLACNCEKVFTIYQNSATPMFSGNETTATHSANSVLLPNNGYYSVSGTTYTKNQTVSEDYLALDTTFESSNYSNYQSHSTSTEIYWCRNNSNPVPLDDSQNYYHLNNADSTDYDTTNDLQQSVTYKTYSTNANIKEYYYQSSASPLMYALIPYSELYYKYTITCSTSANNFKEYKYYVEMGYYPQSLSFYSANAITLGGVFDSKTFTKVSGRTNYYTYNNETYVYSAISAVANSIGLGNNQQTKTGYGMFKLEPIIWTVVGAKNGNTDVLDSLYYSDHMFYTDSICGKPFTGQLELLCAYGLDSTSFNESSSSANYSGSLINTLLNSASDSFYNNNKIFTNSHLFDLQNNYLVQQVNLTTFQASASEGTHYVQPNTGPSMFALSYGKSDIINDTNYAENYAYSDYFKSGVPEGATGSTYSIGVTSLSDFAIARGAENGSHAVTKLNPAIINNAVQKSWATGSTNIAQQNTSSCAYWLRTASASGSNNAWLINLNGVTVTTNTADANICLRPFTVLNLNYYNNASYNQFYGYDNYFSLYNQIIIDDAESSFITSSTIGDTTTYYLPKPTKENYNFAGWYTATTSGTQITDGNGALIKDVSGYTDSSGVWVYSSSIKLYAIWQASN